MGKLSIGYAAPIEVWMRHWVDIAVLNLPLSVLSGVSALAQDVAGARLGVTNVAEITNLRGKPDREGNNNDGWLFVTYGRMPATTFYFSPSDSIVEWIRVHPERGRTSARVREAFGKPDTTQFGDDLSKVEVFKDGTIFVTYGDSGYVQTIEYQPNPQNRIATRRTIVAQGRIDSVLTFAYYGGCTLPWCSSVDSVRDSIGQVPNPV